MCGLAADEEMKSERKVIREPSMGECPSRCNRARPHAGKKGHGRLPGATGCWEVTADQVIIAEL